MGKSMIVFHGGGAAVNFPEIRIDKFTKDFGWGFYCTESYPQETQWARRHKNGHGIPTVTSNVCNIPNTIQTKVYSEMTDEWLDFIATCRSGKQHAYDIVEGPMADDQIWTYVEDFLNGSISREAFWALAKFKKPTHQISFHTASALTCLEFKEATLI